MDPSPSGSDGDGTRLGRHCYSRPMISPVPPLAGLCSIDEVTRPGLPVDECVRRLKRLHYAFRRLHGIFNARITAEPLYELKSAFSYHAYLCAEHVTALRQRVGEMREPPLGLEQVPASRAANSSSTRSSRLRRRARSWPDFTGTPCPRSPRRSTATLPTPMPLADAPSRRVCRFASLEVADMIEFGARALAALLPGHDDRRASDMDWLALDGCLAAAGGLDGCADHRRGRPAAPVLRDALRVRPGAAPRRAVPRPVQHGRQRRGVHLGRVEARAAQAADAVLQAAARDRRARDDGRASSPRRRASRGATTTTCRGSSGTRPATR